MSLHVENFEPLLIREDGTPVELRVDAILTDTDYPGQRFRFRTKVVGTPLADVMAGQGRDGKLAILKQKLRPVAQKLIDYEVSKPTVTVIDPDLSGDIDL